VRVTLVDHHNHHLFQPLLYQVATAALNPSDIAAPIRHVVRRQGNVRVILAEAVAVDAAAKRVILSDGAVTYDYLIAATGVVPSYFGHDDWSHYAPGLKTVEDALEMRRRVLLAYEAAEREPNPERRGEWMTFVVVGGGSTGVELAGALAELARDVLAGDFRTIDPRKARVFLVEAGARILPEFPPGLSAGAERALGRLGVEVLTGQPVADVDGRGISIGGRRLGAKTVLWAAGVKASPLARSLNAPLDRAGRVLVRPEAGREGRTRRRASGNSGRPPRRGQYLARDARGAVRSVPLPRFRHAGHHRPRRGRRRTRPRSRLGIGGVAPLAARPHPLAHRLPQPLPRNNRMGVDLPPLRAGGAPYHGRCRWLNADAGARD
jgi:NADH dehydrogenase